MLSKTPEDTALIAKTFLDKILKNKKRRNGALVVGLSGDLGAGKTAFTQAIARHLAVKHKIISPTFVIMKKYPIKNSQYKFFFHLDAYRLKSAGELLYLGWEEVINNKEHVVFIEWPEYVREVMPRDAHFVRITVNKDDSRNFNFT